MKNTLPFVLILYAMSLSAQNSKVFDNESMTSEILNMERKYAVYLPPDYETSLRSYPVLYLLHGSGDDQTGWVQFGEVKHIADKSIRLGTATPMVIIMPDANAGKKGYFNDPTSDWRYEDFFFEEFMPFVEDKYRIKKEKRYRAVAGLSMGGGGTFIYALHRPDLFSSACPLSAATGPETEEETPQHMDHRGYANATTEQAKNYYKQYSVLHLINTMPDDQKKEVRWYIDCGDDDFLFEGNAKVHIAMKKEGIPHEYRVRDGAHNWTYWRQSLPEVLCFVSEAFQKH